MKDQALLHDKVPVRLDRPLTTEAGQSIVLIALLFVVLLAFVALAVDVGFAFVRSSQFSAAVDAATLAGVVDLDPTSNDTADADLRAAQFLAANGWPTSTLSVLTSTRSLSERGIPQYTMTATWPVQFFFARIIGLGNLEIQHDATAAFFAGSEIHTASQYDLGHIRTAAQFVTGPQGCTAQGDPVSPLQSTAGNPNEDWSVFEGLYTYRIRVSEAYTQSTQLLVELFDADSYNTQGNSATVTHSASDGRPPEALSCGTGMGQRCVINTGESVGARNQNPFWFQRVDENWTSSCTADSGNQWGQAVTIYELYYYDNNDDRQLLAKYTVDNNRDFAFTDLKWVAPGTSGSLVPTDSGSFLVDLATLPVDGNGNRFVHIDVRTSSGSAKNVWDLAARPPNSFYTDQGFPAPATGVNQRNLQIANNPSVYAFRGVSVFALGRLPQSYFVNNTLVQVPLAPIAAIQGGGTLYATFFDRDSAAPPPNIYFTIDTVAESIFRMCTVVVASATGTQTGDCAVSTYDPIQTSCDNGTNCDNSWSRPQFTMGIPDQFFFGGILFANYTPQADDHVWAVSATAGRPFLTR